MQRSQRYQHHQQQAGWLAVLALAMATAPAFAQSSSNNGQNNAPARPGAIPMPRAPLGAVPSPNRPITPQPGQPIIITPPVVCPPPVVIFPPLNTYQQYQYPNQYQQGIYVFPQGNTTTQTYIIPNGVYQNGFYQNPGYVVHQQNVGPTVDLGNGTRVTLFGGYRTTFVSGQTVLSPFGVLYGCQPYIASSLVLRTPYPYASGYVTGQVQPWADNDSFVAADVNRGRGLRSALNDLTRTWENGDLSAFRRRLASDLNVAVFQNERFLYSLRPLDMYALTADTVSSTETIAFRFSDVQQRNDGLVNAIATHTYRVRGENEVRTAKLRFTFVYLEGNWVLSSLALAPGTTR
jgi:hypothetical protein